MYTETSNAYHSTCKSNYLFKLLTLKKYKRFIYRCKPNVTQWEYNLLMTTMQCWFLSSSHISTTSSQCSDIKIISYDPFPSYLFLIGNSILTLHCFFVFVIPLTRTIHTVTLSIHATLQPDCLYLSIPYNLKSKENKCNYLFNIFVNIAKKYMNTQVC